MVSDRKESKLYYNYFSDLLLTKNKFSGVFDDTPGIFDGRHDVEITFRKHPDKERAPWGPYFIDKEWDCFAHVQDIGITYASFMFVFKMKPDHYKESFGRIYKREGLSRKNSSRTWYDFQIDYPKLNKSILFRKIHVYDAGSTAYGLLLCFDVKKRDIKIINTANNIIDLLE